MISFLLIVELDTILKKLDKVSAMVEQLEATSVEPNSERDLQVHNNR